MAKEPKLEKFDFEKLRTGATSANASTRKITFIEYFERFSEYPSYLYDNTDGIDNLLAETIKDLSDDPETSKAMRDGIAVLLDRLPAQNNPLV